MAKTKAADGGGGLKRLGGGRWQTRDERFTIEQESGTWTVVDAEQTDDLGLPLVRGPYRSLTDAKAGIEGARTEGAAPSPLADRLEQARRRAASDEAAKPEAVTPTATKRTAKPGAPEPPPEPRWIADLEPDERRRARRLIERLESAGLDDAEGIVRRDLVGDVAAIAAAAITDRLADIVARPTDDDGDRLELASEIVEALGDGRNGDLDVRWRLVDGDGRPIRLDDADIRDAIRRTRKD